MSSDVRESLKRGRDLRIAVHGRVLELHRRRLNHSEGLDERLSPRRSLLIRGGVGLVIGNFLLTLILLPELILLAWRIHGILPQSIDPMMLSDAWLHFQLIIPIEEIDVI
jgi:hypothetical protein